MPEGPEVRVMTDQLKNLTTQYPCLHTFDVIAGRYTRHPFPNLESFQSLLPLCVSDIKCRGKLIYWIFSRLTDSPSPSQPWYLLNTLGMSGRWSLTREKHAHIEIVLSNESKDDTLTMWFCDPRHFATLTLTQEPEVRLKKIGIDWLDPTSPPTLDNLKTLFMRRSHKTLPVLLMDQSLLSGCGNYLKSEVLYRSKLSPHRTPDTLTPEEWCLLHREMIDTIRESYHSNGTTLATYAAPDGKTGSYFERLQVYQRNQCPLGYQVIRIQTPDKRTTHWVPEVQK